MTTTKVSDELYHVLWIASNMAYGTVSTSPDKPLDWSTAYEFAQMHLKANPFDHLQIVQITDTVTARIDIVLEITHNKR